MERVTFPHKLPSDPISCADFSQGISVYGTAQGSIFVVDEKGIVRDAAISNFSIDRIKVVDRWGVALGIAGSRLLVISLVALKKDTSALIPPDFAALSFAVDPAGDLLFVGCELRNRAEKVESRRIYVIKRAPGVSAAQTVRFDPMRQIDLDNKIAPRDLTLLVDHGQRLLCVSGWESTCFIGVEPRVQQVNVPSLLGSDFSLNGRAADEVVLCRGSSCRFVSGGEERLLLEFGGPLWSLALVGPFIVGFLKTGLAEVRVGTGDLVQTLVITGDDRSRWATVVQGDVVILAGSDTKRRMAYRLNSPLLNFVEVLLKESKAKAALSLALSLLNSSSSVDSETALIEPLYHRAQFALALELLRTKPAASLEDIDRASLVLRERMRESRLDEIELATLIQVFSDTDLFPSGDPGEATRELSVIFPSLKANAKADTPARFKPGCLGVAVRTIILEALLDWRSSKDLSEDQLRALDSLLLRTFIIGRPQKSQFSVDFERKKKHFLEDNKCTVDDSEHLLLSFPEMWEDHAELLVGKGEFDRALKWLQTLTSNAADSDVEKYASAAVRMVDGRPEAALETAKWILARAPKVGVDCLIRFRLFPARDSLVSVKSFLAGYSNQAELLKMFLERFVQEGKACPSIVRDELASIYLSEGNKDALFRLLNESEDMNYSRLLGLLDEWPREQAQVLDRLGRVKEAVLTLATRCSLLEAEAYALSRPGESDLFDTIIDGTMSGDKDDPRSNENMEFLVRNYNRLKNPIKAMSAFDDSMPLDQCLSLIRVALGDKTTFHRHHLVIKNLIRQESLTVMSKLASEKNRSVVLFAQSPTCVQCGRTFKADSPLVTSQDTIWHYSCFKESNPNFRME